MTKYPIRLGRQECKNYLLLHSLFTFLLECSVFPIQSSDVCSQTRLIRKTTCETLRGANATIAFIILTIHMTGDKTSYCTLFGLARVQKLFTTALSIHIYNSLQYFQYNLQTFALTTRLIRKSMCELLSEANATGAVRAFSVTKASA